MSYAEFANVIKTCAEAASAVCAVVSAAYWLQSSNARRGKAEIADDDGFIAASVTIVDSNGSSDLGETLAEQSRLNSIAARWAAGAAIGMAVVAFVDVVRGVDALLA